MSTARQKSRVDEEDDLDDLDDVLDQFASPPQSSTTTTTTAKAAPPSASSSSSKQPTSAASATLSQTAAAAHDDKLSDAFAAEFAKEMEALFNDLRNNPGVGSDKDGAGGTGGSAAHRELADAWESMLVEGMNEMTGPSSSSSSADPSPPGQDFQSSIRSTMHRLRERESGLNPPDASASAGAGGGGLDALLAQFKGMEGLGSDGEEGNEQLQGVLEEMMGQLMSKDVLYEPLKELHEKFPGYLTEHAKTISAADKKRYEAQIECIKRLLGAFEAPSYRDGDENTRGQIVELMGELQTHGSPPEEIMGPLPQGFSMGPDGLPEMPEGCNVN